MFAIGSFAQVAKVSVRTLRHYDDVGLLRPARVDPANGYRFYEAAQLPRLNRIIVLKELGFTLAEITRMIEAGISPDELLGMLKLRRTEAERTLAMEQQRLADMTTRIQLLQGERAMSSSVVVKPIDAMRIAQVTEPADGFNVDFPMIFERLYSTLYGELGRARIAPIGPPLALYGERADGRVDMIGAVQIDPDADLASDSVVIRDLPAGRAATLIHEGNMSTCPSSYQALQQWMEAAGEEPDGYGREIYLDCDGHRDSWVTELQFVLK
jgi:DNA-binding transcriptional MerR regulator